MVEIVEVNRTLMEEVKTYLDNLMKPVGSLGILEDLAVQISGITGEFFNPISRSAHVVFSSDNGVEKEGVSCCPREYTRIVSESILSGHGAVSILAKSNYVDLYLVDVGIDGKIDREYKNFFDKKIKNGSGNIKIEKAMEKADMLKALEIGMNMAIKLSKDNQLLSCGEMGIGNTTTSTALISALLGEEITVGTGSGIDDEKLSIKKEVIKKALSRVEGIDDPLTLLGELGGFDIAAMVGFYLGCAYKKIPIVLDGFISSASALCAYKLYPQIRDYFICAHNSLEPGMTRVLEELGLKAIINTNMALGEGTGAILCHPIVKSANGILQNMRTKEEIYTLLK